MTNTAKKPAKKSDTLDLDLDARLDSASATLYLDDEPVEGDMLDQVLAKAKKELDTIPQESIDTEDLDIALDLPVVDTHLELNETEQSVPLQSESLTSLENQLTAVLETPAISDHELDNLLGSAGFDFDSLLGEGDDELNAEITSDEDEMNEDALLAAVDELLNFSAEEVSTVEPKVVEIAQDIRPVTESEIAEIEQNIEPTIEPDDTELKFDFEFETEGFLEPEISEISSDRIEKEDSPITELENISDFALTVEPDAALDDLVDSVPFEEILKTENSDETDEIFTEEFNDFDNVADIAAPLVEISLPSDDELDVAQQLDGLNDAMENTIDDTASGFDLLDDAAEKAKTTLTAENAEDDLDWMKQLDELDASGQETPAKTENVSSESDSSATVEEEGEDDWLKQLENLDDETSHQESEESPMADADDWMKQLDDLDSDAAAEITNANSDDDDWKTQLEKIDDSDETIDQDFNIADQSMTENTAPARPIIDEESLIAKAAEIALEQFKSEQETAIDEVKEKQDIAITQLRADQDSFEAKNRKQFADAEDGRKKAATFGFAALGVGIVGLIGSGAIGYLSMGAKTQTETLQQSVTELQETVNDIVNKAPEKEKEIANIKTSVEQLNQKVEKLVAAQAVQPVAVTNVSTETGHVAEVKTVEPAKSVVAPTNGKVSTTAPKVAPLTTGKVDTGIDAPKLPETDIAPPVDITPEHPTGEKVVPKLADMAKKTSDDAAAKAKTEKVAREKAEQAKAKEEAALLTEKLTKISTIAKAAAASTKTQEPIVSRYSGKMTRGMAHGIAKDKAETRMTKPEVKDAKKEVLNASIKQPKAVPAGKYAVNVVSYQQEWFAQSKAAEFKQKGIPVEVVPADPNNYGTKYRLKVTGFKTKAEASAYAKSKGLNEAWVSN